MTWKPPQKKWDWKSFLTVDEARDVKRFEKEQSEARERLRVATAEIAPIRNRAIHRAKYRATGD